MIARDATGCQRCVLLAKGSRLSYQFPEGEIDDSTGSADGASVSVPTAEPPAHEAPPHSGASAETSDIDELARCVDEQIRVDVSARDGQDLAGVLGAVIPSASDIADRVVKKLTDSSDFHESSWRATSNGTMTVGKPR